jgi:hypothetical protein
VRSRGCNLERRGEKSAFDATRFHTGVALQADRILRPKQDVRVSHRSHPRAKMAPFWARTELSQRCAAIAPIEARPSRDHTPEALKRRRVEIRARGGGLRQGIARGLGRPRARNIELGHARMRRTAAENVCRSAHHEMRPHIFAASLSVLCR